MAPAAIAMQKKANPTKISELTNANILGMTACAKSPEAGFTATLGGSRLATMLARGAKLGRP